MFAYLIGRSPNLAVQEIRVLPPSCRPSTKRKGSILGATKIMQWLCKCADNKYFIFDKNFACMFPIETLQDLLQQYMKNDICFVNYIFNKTFSFFRRMSYLLRDLSMT